jgi:tetratricopeptide (TPR) repeat protein
MTSKLLLFLTLTLAAQDHAALGMKAIEDQKFEEAIGHFTKAVAADPKDYYSWFHLALANSAIHKDAEAIEQYRKTLALMPKLYQAELNLGIILVENRKAKEAIPLLTDAIQQKPAEFRPAYYLAEAYLAEANYPEAEKAYQNATALDPKSAPAWYGLARSQMKQNRFDDAQPNFIKAGDFDPQYKDSVLELAAVHEEQKRVDAAIAIYRMFPQTAAAQERLGALLLAQNKPAEAVGPLEFAVGKSATTGNRFALAKAYLQSNQPDKALKLVDQTIAAEPKEAELYMIRGRILRDQRKLQDAANSFYAAAKLQPNNAEAWTEMAGMVVLLEDFPTAIAVLDKVRQLNAEKAGHYFLRAIVLDKTKQLKPALEAYQKFLATSEGKNPDQEFQARQRAKIIEKELSKK